MAIYLLDDMMQVVRLGYIFLFQTNDNDNKRLRYRLYFSKLCRLKILKFCYQLHDWLLNLNKNLHFVSRSKTRALRRNSIWFSGSRYSYLGTRPLDKRNASAGDEIEETGKQII